MKQPPSQYDLDTLGQVISRGAGHNPFSGSLAARKWLQTGSYASAPDTTGWGFPEEGRFWFNEERSTIGLWIGNGVVTLAVERFINVKEFGAVGNGITDDSAAIATAILYCRRLSNSAPSDQCAFSKLSNWNVLYFPPGSYVISSPILIESDYESTPYTLLDNVLVLGDQARIIASAGFTGVSREYDEVPNSETVNAMMIFGPRDYGNEGGQYQAHNGVFGLTFDASNVAGTDMLGIRCDVCYMPVFANLKFEELHHCIDYRVAWTPTITNCKGYKCDSLVYAVNTSDSLGGTKWGTGIECGGPMISDCFIHFTLNDTYVAKYTGLGKIHIVNIAEFNIQNVKFLAGGGIGIYLEGGGKGKQWGSIDSVELGSMYYRALEVVDFRKVGISNFQAIKCMCHPDAAGGHDSTVRALVYLNDCRRILIDKMILDQNTVSGYFVSAGLHIKGQSNSVQNSVIAVEPYATNTYAAVRIDDGTTYPGDYNRIIGNEIGDVRAPGNVWQHGVYAPAGPDYNIVGMNAIVNYNVARVTWGAVANNINPNNVG